MSIDGKLRALIETTSRVVELCFAEFGTVAPTWFIIETDGNKLTIPGPSDDKETAVAMMRALFELMPTQRYCHVVEAWIVSGKDAPELDHRATARDVRRHPARREIIMFSGEDANGCSLVAMRAIDRTQRKRAQLGPLTFANRGSTRFMSLLPRATMLQ